MAELRAGLQVPMGNHLVGFRGLGFRGLERGVCVHAQDSWREYMGQAPTVLTPPIRSKKDFAWTCHGFLGVGVLAMNRMF